MQFKRLPLAPDGSEKEGGITYYNKPGAELVEGIYRFRRMPTGMGPCIQFKRVPLPVADFSGTPLSGDAPLTVQFTDLSQYADSWAWSFGDGGTSADQNPAHEYAESDEYTVTLEITNKAGTATETKTGYISVTETQPQGEWQLKDDDTFWVGEHETSYPYSTSMIWDIWAGDDGQWEVAAYGNNTGQYLEATGSWASGFRPTKVKIGARSPSSGMSDWQIDVQDTAGNVIASGTISVSQGNYDLQYLELPLNWQGNDIYKIISVNIVPYYSFIGDIQFFVESA